CSRWLMRSHHGSRSPGPPNVCGRASSARRREERTRPGAPRRRSPRPAARQPPGAAAAGSSRLRVYGKVAGDMVTGIPLDMEPMLSQQTPATFIAFDLLGVDGEDLRARPLVERRPRLERELRDSVEPLHVTPYTQDLEEARDWFDRFEGAGLDGLIAKRLDQP